MIGGTLRKLIDRFRRWPLHPQWLLHVNELRPAWLFDGLDGLVVDVGCAGGESAALLPPTCRYVGVDYPVTAASYGTRPQVHADGSRLPFRSKTIDACLLLDVLEHVRYPDAALDEAARVLRPGGHLVVTIPFLYPIHDAPHDYQRYTRHGLERLLHDRGFRLERMAPRLRDVETAGLLACLALADSARLILQRRWWLLPVLPFLAIAVPVLNIGTLLAARVLPQTSFMPAGYALLAVRDADSAPG